MRCPKCGYISFDNVGTCLKCKKDISGATSTFQGSTLNVSTPSFLKIDTTEEEMALEGAAEVGGEIEFADPDLEILVDDDDDDDDGIDFSLDEDDADSSEDDLALAEEFGDMETFGDDEEDEDIDLAADLGAFEDVQEDEDTFSFEDDDESEALEEEAETAAAMEIPEELADISDLSPPDTEDDALESVAVELDTDEPAAALEAAVDLEEEEFAPAAEPDDDLDFSSLDMDLDLDGSEEPAGAFADEPAEPAASAGSDMDEELNFDLDLGGLSIHDELK